MIAAAGSVPTKLPIQMLSRVPILELQGTFTQRSSSDHELRSAIRSNCPTLRKKIEQANIAMGEMKDLSGIVRNTPSATNKLQTIVDMISPIIAPLKAFNPIANGIADVLGLYLHPLQN